MEEMTTETTTTAAATAKVPRTLFDFVEILAPVAKYYVVLLVFYYVARHFNRALDEEARMETPMPTQRPTLSTELMPGDSDDDEEEENGERSDDNDVHEELVTDGSKLVPKNGGDAELRDRKANKKHPLFEGLQKVEEEIRNQSKEEAENVSWNDLHSSMLKKYQEKFPEHGLRTADGDDYDDEFKELMRKHNVDPEALRAQRKKAE